MEETIKKNSKPYITIVIEADGIKNEYTLSEPLFNSLDEACKALHDFFDNNRS